MYCITNNENIELFRNLNKIVEKIKTVQTGGKCRESFQNIMHICCGDKVYLNRNRMTNIFA